MAGGDGGSSGGGCGRGSIGGKIGQCVTGPCWTQALIDDRLPEFVLDRRRRPGYYPGNLSDRRRRPPEIQLALVDGRTLALAGTALGVETWSEAQGYSTERCLFKGEKCDLEMPNKTISYATMLLIQCAAL